MNKRQQDFLLGLVAIGLLALLIGSVFFIEPLKRLATRSVEVRFDHETGIAPIGEGSPVLLSGALNVGKVTGIRTETIRVGQGESSKRRLIIIVEAQVDTALKLYEDCQITTDAPPIGGGGFLVIADVGTPEAGLLADRPIVGLPPQSLGAAISALSRRLFAPEGIVDQFERMLDPEAEGALMNRVLVSLHDINEITSELRTQMNPREQRTLLNRVQLIMEDLQATSAAIRAQTNVEDQATLLAKLGASTDRLNESLAEVLDMLRENRATVRDTVASVESLARKLDQDLYPAIRGELLRDDPGSMLGKLHTGMNSLVLSLENVQVMTENGRQLLVLNKPAVDRAIANAVEMSTQLRLASEEIRIAPWRLLHTPSDRETGDMRVFEAARTFAAAAESLDEAASRLQAILASGAAEKTSASGEKEIEKIQESLRSAFERFQRAEDFLFEQMKP